MSVKDMRDELRALRKEAVKPISKMKKGDISAEIERLKGMRAETPASAAVPSAPPRKGKPAVESIKEAKKEEFPVAPEHSGTKKGEPRKTARKAYEPKKKAEKKDKKDDKKDEKKEKKEEKKESKKPAKGSEEMKEKMKKLREMRGKKKE